MLVDSHCHLDFPDFAGRLPEMLAAMAQNEVGLAVCVGVKLEDVPRVIALAEQDERLFASVGVHPECCGVEEPDVERLLRLSEHPKVIAIGETGLDYHWHPDRPEWQRQRFRTHIRASRSSGKPLIVHMRDATEDTLRLLREEATASGVMHCFTGDWEAARQVLDLGFYLSFSGIVTFKNARDIREVAQKAPLDRILVETDSPYLAPVPHRGRQNQPAYVRHVAEELARLRGLDLEKLAQATTQNFFNLFPNALGAISS